MSLWAADCLAPRHGSRGSRVRGRGIRRCRIGRAGEAVGEGADGHASGDANIVAGFVGAVVGAFVHEVALDREFVLRPDLFEVDEGALTRAKQHVLEGGDGEELAFGGHGSLLVARGVGDRDVPECPSVIHVPGKESGAVGETGTGNDEGIPEAELAGEVPTHRESVGAKIEWRDLEKLWTGTRDRSGRGALEASYFSMIAKNLFGSLPAGTSVKVVEATSDCPSQTAQVSGGVERSVELTRS